MAQDSADEEITVEARIDAAETVLETVDELARRCVEQLTDSANGARPEACTEMMAAIDGEALAGYLAHCDELRLWRNAYIEDPPAAGPDSERDRQRLIGVERVCGEDVLRNRAEIVVDAYDAAFEAAFDALRERGERRPGELSMQRRLSELEFQSTLGGWRNELDVTNSNRRVRAETSQQFDQLEEELIRQQINRPRTYPF